MKLSLDFGGYRCTRPLERWLSEAEPARSIISGDMIDGPIGDPNSIKGVKDFEEVLVLATVIASAGSANVLVVVISSDSENL